MILILRCFSLKTADFATFPSEVGKLIMHEEKWEKTEKKLYSQFPEIKENCHINFSYKIIETDLKK